MIYAKRLLRGPAKIFVRYEGCCRNWSEMKRALRSEFSQVVDAHKIHKELPRRIKKSNETYQENSKTKSRRTEEKKKGTIRKGYRHIASDCNGDETIQIDRDDSTSMEQDANATSTEAVNMDESSMKDPETSSEGASEFPVSSAAESAAEDIPVDPKPSVDAQPDENEIPTAVSNDPETVNETDMQDMNEASAAEAQVKLEESSMQDPIEALSEEASMPDAMELSENDDEVNGLRTMI